MNINELSLMSWLDWITSPEIKQEYATPLLIDWPARCKVVRIHLWKRNCISEWMSDVFMRRGRENEDQSGVKGAECVWVCVFPGSVTDVFTCEVRVVWGVDEIVGEGEGHVFALVQLLRWDDAVLLSAQILGESFHRDLTCVNTIRYMRVSVKLWE